MGEQLIKETEKEQPVRREGNQENNTVLQKPGEECLNQEAMLISVR